MSLRPKNPDYSEPSSREEEVEQIVQDTKEDRRNGEWERIEYFPNNIPLKRRVVNTLKSIGLITYGTFGVSVGMIIITGKSGSAAKFTGVPMWIMYAAMLLASANMLAVVVDHYVRRKNEESYMRFAKVTSRLGWYLAIFAFVLQIAIYVFDISK